MSPKSTLRALFPSAPSLVARPSSPTRVAFLPALLLGLLGLRAAGPAPAVGQEIPSPSQVLGWELGDRFTDVSQVRRYFSVLAENSDRVSLHEYGETNEGRALVQVLIAHPRYRERLDAILAQNRELTDPGTSEARARELIGTNPGVVYFSYGVHGNESSSSEAAMWTAWDLVRGSEDTAGVLDSLIVILDPVVNPDGRERYVNFYRQARGAAPDPDPRAREHREPWPGGRYNHYLFDLNRDWAWMSQRETRARLATWDHWTPLVHVDFHEMGWRSEYFFFPAAKPINPIYPPHILEWGERIGTGNAEAFDREGWLYFTGENYDLFYPGYGDSWPSLTGAIGMTYEQAGGGFGGLMVDRPDGTRLTLRDRATHHWVAGKATLRTAAQGKSALMEGFARFHRNVDQGFEPVLLVPDPGSRNADALVTLLRAQGIEVERAGQSFRTEASPHAGFEPRREFPAGTFRVRPRQPRGRLAMALLWPEHFLDAEFSYDISSWSLPYAYGVEAHTGSRIPDAAWEAVVETLRLGSAAGEDTPGPEGTVAGGDDARYGYLLLPDFAHYPGLVDFLEGGGAAYAVQDTFTLAGVSYPRGTLVLPRGFNPDLETRVNEAGLAAWVTPIRSGLTEGGPDLGTNDRIRLSLPRVGLLSGDGTSATSMGAHWYFLEKRLGIPFHQIAVEDLGSVELADVDVIVVPSGGGITSRAGGQGMDALADWIREGGTLVAVEGSARALGQQFVEVEERVREEDELDEELRLDRALRTREERDRDRWLEDVPGTILPLVLDPSHPLAYGAGAAGDPSSGFALSSGRAFEPDPGLEAVAYFPEDLPKTSGVISEENLERLSRSAWLVQARMGAGRLILFADDPLFRMFWYGGFQFYANALLLGPQM